MTTWSPVRYAHNEGVAIAYSTAGAGEQDVLLIGGFVGHLEISRHCRWQLGSGSGWPDFPG